MESHRNEAFQQRQREQTKNGTEKFRIVATFLQDEEMFFSRERSK
jgi:hypothetical protein